MMQAPCQEKDLDIQTIDFGDLEYSVGPSGSSEAIVGLPCFAVMGAIAIIRAM
jgi:hypothetical protein